MNKKLEEHWLIVAIVMKKLGLKELEFEEQDFVFDKNSEPIGAKFEYDFDNKKTKIELR